MKKTTLILAMALIAILSLNAKNTAKTKLAKNLMQVPGVTSVTRIESSRFKERYIVTFRQYIDHHDTTLGTFQQRIIIGNVHPDSTTIYVTEGYACTYTEKPDYREELSDILNANSIIIEHRYFNQSKPQTKNQDQYWDYLTTYNAATDHHRIVQAFKTLYKGKNIATGVSKGGICAYLFRAYYPEDIDITVPYVAPLCDGPEDPRMGENIPGYGPHDQRTFLNEFMNTMFERKGEILPYFTNHIDSAQLKTRIEPYELYDFTLLDLEIAVMARGEIKQLPDPKTATPEELNRTLIKYGAPEGFTPSYDNMPYYIQAAREIGHYAYNTKRYSKYTNIDTHDYLRRLALPENFNYEYDSSTRKMVLNFLKTTDAKMLFLYGKNDPWTSVGILDLINNPNIYIIVHPDNCHRTKIRNCPERTKHKILSILNSWLYKKEK